MRKHLPKRARFWIGLVILAVTLFSIPVGYGLAQDGATVTIDPSSSEVAVGDQTAVDIRVENVADLYGIEVHLTFDPALLEVVDADVVMPGIQVELLNSFLQPEMVVSNNADNTAGTIMCTAMQLMPSLPVTGTGDLVAITFQGNVEELSDIQFVALDLFDQNGLPITTT